MHPHGRTHASHPRATASEKRWEKELARSSSHSIPTLKWPIIYRGTHPALLTPADSHQLSKMVHRGIFTNAARPTLEERGCRLGCGRISNPVEHMSHLATCRKTTEVRLWALRLISAIDGLPPLPWPHGLVPFFCLGLAPPPECKEGCQVVAGCTCLSPLSAGGYAVLALTLRHLYAALTKLAVEELPKLIQPQIITSIAEVLRDRISSFFALTRHRLVSAENRGQELDIAAVVRRAAGNLLSADGDRLTVHPAAHLAIKEAGAEMPKALRWRYTPAEVAPQQPLGPSAATPLGSAEAEEATQRGPAAAHQPQAGTTEATQRGHNSEAEDAGEARPRDQGPGAAGHGGVADESALLSADRMAQGLLARSPARQVTPPRQPPARARRYRLPICQLRRLARALT